MEDGWEAFDRRTLHERVGQQVRDRLLDGSLAPGTPLAEAQLARSLMVSRGTVRDALRELQREGLVAWEPRRPPTVRRLSAREVQEVYEVRQLLEGRAAATLASAPPADREVTVGRLEAALGRLHTARTGPITARIATDLQFHELVCELAGNRVLLDTWRNLLGVIRLILLAAPVDALRSMEAADHQDVVTAIRAGFPEGATTAVAAHFAAAPLLFAAASPPLVASATGDSTGEPSVDGDDFAGT